MTDAISTFFDAWGMAETDARQATVLASFAQDATYMDPRTQSPLTGPEAVSEYVGMFAAQAPGAVAEVTNAETRGGVTRATISFRMPDGKAQSGQYYVEHGSDGLISRMVGFVGTGAPA